MQPDDILEMLMLICFSTGWYWSIGYMVVTGKPYGKSGVFVLCTILGYMLGLISKVWAWHVTLEMSYVLLIYCWNLSIASLDLALLCHLSRGPRTAHQDMHFLHAAPTSDLNKPAHLIHAGPVPRRHHTAQAVRLDRL